MSEPLPGSIGGVDVGALLKRLGGGPSSPDDPPIHPVDVNGVLMAAIQGVNQRIEEQGAELDSIAERLAAAGASGPGAISPAGRPSDRELKRDERALDSHDVLRRLAALEITTWSYKTDDPSVRHIGPMAQDFAAAFEVGDNNKVINLMDAAGVCLAAIQALGALMEEQQDRIEGLRDELERLGGDPEPS